MIRKVWYMILVLITVYLEIMYRQHLDACDAGI